MTEKEQPYCATDEDLPKELWAPPRRSIDDARAEVLRQMRDMGMHRTEVEITLCSIILFAYWQDAERDKEVSR